ncbi:hypothetical protein [Undibacterium griseum]|uniref:Uncharacterized protein n=1 Tax=Undibacterium griseum TaxID=2762295 RepID=A0ABR6YS41_9BURK|nr:hypothetical protein [Undibacterium griseum]MBC3886599.1 hypothetical protein [Undibacterium griseum]
MTKLPCHAGKSQAASEKVHKKRPFQPPTRHIQRFEGVPDASGITINFHG